MVYEQPSRRGCHAPREDAAGRGWKPQGKMPNHNFFILFHFFGDDCCPGANDRHGDDSGAISRRGRQSQSLRNFFEEITLPARAAFTRRWSQPFFLRRGHADYWTLVTQGTAAGAMSVDSTRPLNTNIPNSLKLTMSSGAGSVGAANSGFWECRFKPARLTFEFLRGGFQRFHQANHRAAGKFQRRRRLCAGFIQRADDELAAFLRVADVKRHGSNAQMVLSISNAGTVWLDVVSLFPQATFNSRTNGMRADLGNMLSALIRRFCGFPAGIIQKGSSVSDAFRGKQPLATSRTGPAMRTAGATGPRTAWVSRVSALCEDLGMTPLFDINSGRHSVPTADTNNTVPMDEMGRGCRRLDAIEYANGATTQRGRGSAPPTASRAVQFAIHGNRNEAAATNLRRTLRLCFMRRSCRIIRR